MMTSKNISNGILIDDKQLGLELYSNDNYCKSDTGKDESLLQPNCVSKAQWTAFTIEEEFCKPQVVNKVGSPNEEITRQNASPHVEETSSFKNTDDYLEEMKALDLDLLYIFLKYELQQNRKGALEIENHLSECNMLIGRVVKSGDGETLGFSDGHMKMDADIWVNLNKVMRLNYPYP